ncbi:TBC1 domain family member 22A-like protein [Cricetulus griseus]|nr:TBC1 domain family member 22A-like protein [Cricetulus griseus]
MSIVALFTVALMPFDRGMMLKTEDEPTAEFGQCEVERPETSAARRRERYCEPEELRKLSWSGIPKPVRPMTWKLLSGYLPANVDRRPATLQRKQKEYFAFIEHYYNSRNDEAHQDTYRQIHIDIPRMSPEALILQPKVTE